MNSTDKYSLNICHLYADLLNLYGDSGNIISMKKRLQWRGINCNVEEVNYGEKLDGSKFDLFFIGGGQDFEQSILMEDVKKNKREEIINAVDDEKVFLAICGGYQLLGNYYKTLEGVQMDFLGCLNVHTEGKENRLIGDYMFHCEEINKAVVGFENHSGRTYLGDGVKPLGKIISGYGNNGEDGTEGAVYKNVFASYGHGALLPKNPVLCDMLLKKALERKYPNVNLKDLDDVFENKAHDFIKKRLNP